MFLLQFLCQSGGRIEIWRQRDGTAQRVCDRRLARAAGLPVPGHHAQLLGDDFRQRGVPRLGLLFRILQNVGIQLDRQCRAHGGETSPFYAQRQACKPVAARETFVFLGSEMANHEIHEGYEK